jgi:hypothetical protein
MPARKKLLLSKVIAAIRRAHGMLKHAEGSFALEREEHRRNEIALEAGKQEWIEPISQHFPGSLR